MPYSHLTCPFSGGTSALKTFRVSALLQILDQSFVFFFLSASNAGAPEIGTVAPPSLNCLRTSSCTQRVQGAPLRADPVLASPSLRPGPLSFRVGVEQGCKYL